MLTKKATFNLKINKFFAEDNEQSILFIKMSDKRKK